MLLELKVLLLGESTKVLWHYTFFEVELILLFYNMFCHLIFKNR